MRLVAAIGISISIFVTSFTPFAMTFEQGYFFVGGVIVGWIGSHI